MADIELVIKIDEHLYDSCKKEFDNLKENEHTDCYTYAIANGTPLPKGHGRLIDADAIIDKNAYDLDNNFVVDLCDIREAKAIIEADKEEKCLEKNREKHQEKNEMMQ